MRKLLLTAAVSAVAVAGLAPTVASAQRYYGRPTAGFEVSIGTSAYRPAYYDDDYYDRRQAWIAHERWEQRRRWQEEHARREYWEHRHEDDEDDYDRR